MSKRLWRGNKKQTRIKQMKKFEKQQIFISIKLFQPIRDPEAE